MLHLLVVFVRWLILFYPSIHDIICKLQHFYYSKAMFCRKSTFCNLPSFIRLFVFGWCALFYLCSLSSVCYMLKKEIVLNENKMLSAPRPVGHHWKDKMFAK